MVGKLGEIKQTASDAVETIGNLGTPEVQQSLQKLKDITDNLKAIIQKMQQDQETIIVIKEMVTSIKELMNEIKVSIKTSTRSSDGIIYNVKQTAGEVKDLYKNQTGYAKDLRKS